MLDNWKDLVLIQPFKSAEEYQKCYFIKSRITNDGEMQVIMVAVRPHWIETEQELIIYLDTALKSFTNKCGKNSIERYKNIVAMTTKRGIPRKRYDNSYFYVNKGTSGECDGCLAVIEYDSKYGVAKHPDFDNYGFIVEKE